MSRVQTIDQEISLIDDEIEDAVMRIKAGERAGRVGDGFSQRAWGSAVGVDDSVGPFGGRGEGDDKLVRARQRQLQRPVGSGDEASASTWSDCAPRGGAGAGYVGGAAEQRPSPPPPPVATRIAAAMTVTARGPL